MDNPYQGLKPYSTEDHDKFFGRTKETQYITNNILAWSLTILYGESGIGKSSLLRAGVIYKLQEETKEEAKQNVDKTNISVLAAVIFPNLKNANKDDYSSWEENILEKFKKFISGEIQKQIKEIGFTIAADQISAVANEVSQPKCDLIKTLEKWTKLFSDNNYFGRIVIILDQFEDYFQNPDDKYKEAFIKTIAKILDNKNLRVHFLIAIREDFYFKLNSLKRYIPNILKFSLHLENIVEDEEIRNIIKKPIEKYNEKNKINVTIDDDLVNHLLEAIRESTPKTNSKTNNNTIPLPYLQLIMVRLWKKMVEAKSDRLYLTTLLNWGDKTYTDIDAIQYIFEEYVEKQIEQAIDKLSENNKSEKEKLTRILAEVLKYLVAPSGSKYAYFVKDLAKIKSINCEPNYLIDLFNELDNDTRFLNQLPTTGDDSRYEIFHEMLALPILKWLEKYTEAKEKQKKKRREITYGEFSVVFLLLLSFIVESFSLQKLLKEKMKKYLSTILNLHNNLQF